MFVEIDLNEKECRTPIIYILYRNIFVTAYASAFMDEHVNVKNKQCKT